MKKNKLILLYMLIFVMTFGFSNVVFAESELGLGEVYIEVTNYNDNGQASLKTSSGILPVSGLSQDENGRYYYNNGQRNVYFEGTLEVNGKQVAIEVLTSPSNVTYIKLPNDVTADDFKKGASINLNDENIIIDISNLKVDQQEIKEGDMGALETVWGLITDTVSTLTKLVESILNDILLPLGDGMLYQISRAVGESVTIDKIIFNGVSKVDINYWDQNSSGGSVKNIMKSVVSYWYKEFRKIAIVVYMVVLVGIGVSIMLNSTANKKAQYKEALMSWVIGVAILFLFPYVMKYMVLLNNSVVAEMGKNINSTSYGSGDNIIVDDSEQDESLTNDLSFMSFSENEAYETFGKDAFVSLMLGKNIVEDEEINLSEVNDSMMKTRVLAQKTGKIILTVVYFILIGQTLVLLLAYYKRAFMIAFLITIFPLVAMTFAIDKLGDKKAQSFGIWFKEYTVNVVVQMFHAAVYYVIVNTSVNLFLSTNGSNWLFMILSVLFLFEGEKILRNIFNVKSSAGTLGDLAATGAVVMSVAKGTKDIISGKNEDDGHKSQDDKEAESAVKARQANSGNNLAAQNAKNATSTGNAASAGKAGATATASSSSSSGASSANNGGDASSSGSNAGGAQSATPQSTRDNVAKQIYNRKSHKSMLSKAVSTTAKTVGGTIGATYGLATGGIQGAVASAKSGSEIGGLVASPLNSLADKASDRRYGNKMANAIENGAMDDQVAEISQLTEAEEAMARAEAYARAVNGEEISDEEVIAKYGTKKQEIMREALAVYTRELAKHGEGKARLSYEEYLDTHRLS